MGNDQHEPTLRLWGGKMRSEYGRALIRPPGAGILPDALAAPSPPPCSTRPAPIAPWPRPREPRASPSASRRP